MNSTENLEKIYLDIVRVMLEKPEKWSKFGNRSFNSPYINEEEQIRFQCYMMMGASKVYIVKKYDTIHELDISIFDFKTRKQIRELYKYWRKVIEQEESDRKFNQLKDSLGVKMERFIKLSKIKNKM